MKSRANLFVKTGLFVVVLSWLLYTGYRFDRSIDWMVKNLTSQVQLTIQEPLIPIIMGTVGLGARTAAALIALVVVLSFLGRRELSKTVKLIGLAVLLEAIYFLSFVPAAISNFFYADFLLVFVESGISIMTQTIVMPIILLKLRSKLSKSSESYGEVVKWGSIAGISYLFVLWLNFSMQWFGTFIMPETYTSTYPGYGINYVLKYPLNMFSFLLTFAGLFLLIVFFVWSSAPAIKGSIEKLSLRRVGVTLTAFGGYFILMHLLFVVFGPVGGYSIWNAVFTYFSVDAWCVALPALGVPLMFI